jgi:hypothetical protein
MAQYCFAEQRRALFTEAMLRGWWQACVDFPRHEGQAEADTMQTSLRAEVCCIGSGDDFAYRQLVVSAYVAGYRATLDVSERDRFLMAFALKGMSPEQGMALIRHGMSSQDGQAEIDRAYTQFEEAVAPRALTDSFSPSFRRRARPGA